MLVRAAVALALAMTAMALHAQAPAVPAGPSYDVVSIKRSPVNPGGPTTIGVTNRPDGGITATRTPVTTLIRRAYGLDIAEQPDWASTELFDVTATANLKGATAEERSAMLKAMLAERFNLLVHIEDREYDVYELVVAREDGRPGPGLRRIETDCVAVLAEREAARVAALAKGLPSPLPQVGRTGALPPCSLRSVADQQYAGRMEGQTTMDNFASALVFTTWPRQVVNKTGLPGSYEVALEFDARPMQSGPALAAPALDSKPSIFTALQEQLGLRLVPSRITRPTVVIDRLDRPSEN